MADDLGRFVAAQDRVWADVLAELGAGRKRTHWMWFVFPQLAGLGSSPMAVRYAIGSLDEARAYLAHPLLGARLREVTRLMLAQAGGAGGGGARRHRRDEAPLVDDAVRGRRRRRRRCSGGAGGVLRGEPDPRTLALLGR